MTEQEYYEATHLKNILRDPLFEREIKKLQDDLVAEFKKCGADADALLAIKYKHEALTSIIKSLYRFEADLKIAEARNQQEK